MASKTDIYCIIRTDKKSGNIELVGQTSDEHRALEIADVTNSSPLKSLNAVKNAVKGNYANTEVFDKQILSAEGFFTTHE
jgi:hypothetical protein